MRRQRTMRTALAVVALPVRRPRRPDLGATCGINAQQVATAKVAFVGTLTAASAAGDFATFAVSEVWGPEDLPAVVQISEHARAMEHAARPPRAHSNTWCSRTRSARAWW